MSSKGEVIGAIMIDMPEIECDTRATIDMLLSYDEEQSDQEAEAMLLREIETRVESGNLDQVRAEAYIRQLRSPVPA